MHKDKKARESIEGKEVESSENEDNPPAGPHAKRHLTDKSKTPGSGSLSDENDDDINPGSG